MNVRRQLIGIVAALLVVSTVGPFVTLGGAVAAPTTLTVDDDGTADYTTIQAAIDAASAGDTVSVASGTYVESLVVDKAITLTGVPGSGAGNGTDAPVIAPDDGIGINVTASNVVVEGFYVIPYHYTETVTYPGGSYTVPHTDDGIAVSPGGTTLSGVVIRDNTVVMPPTETYSYARVALGVSNGGLADLVVVRNRIVNDKQEGGSRISLVSGYDMAKLENATFEENVLEAASLDLPFSSQEGGLNGGSYTFRDVVVRNNTAMSMYIRPTGQVADVTVVDNQVTDLRLRMGALSEPARNIAVRDNTIATATTGSYSRFGRLSVSVNGPDDTEAPAMAIDGLTVSGNTITGDGLSLSVSGRTEFTDTAFTENAITWSDGEFMFRYGPAFNVRFDTYRGSPSGTITVSENLISGGQTGLEIRNDRKRSSTSLEGFDLRVTNNRITEATSQAAYVDIDAASVTLTGNEFNPTVGSGLNYDGDGVLDARENFWGNASGPSSDTSGPSNGLEDPETGLVADGSGSSVGTTLTTGVSNIRFDPFLDAFGGSVPSVDTGRAQFAVGSLEVGPESPTVDEMVTLTVTVRNTGTATGRYSGSVAADFEQVDNVAALVAPGTSIPLSVTTTFDRPGVFDVTIGNDYVGTVTVKPQEPFEFTVVGDPRASSVVATAVNPRKDEPITALLPAGDEANRTGVLLDRLDFTPTTTTDFRVTTRQSGLAPGAPAPVADPSASDAPVPVILPNGAAAQAFFGVETTLPSNGLDDVTGRFTVDTSRYPSLDAGEVAPEDVITVHRYNRNSGRIVTLDATVVDTSSSTITLEVEINPGTAYAVGVDLANVSATPTLVFDRSSGEPPVVEFTVENTGETAGNYLPVAFVGRTVVTGNPVIVDAGETTTATVSLDDAFDRPGLYFVSSPEGVVGVVFVR